MHTHFVAAYDLSSEQVSQMQDSINDFVSSVIPAMLSFFVNSVLGIAANLPVLLTSLTIAADFWLGFWVLMIYLGVVCNSETIIRPKFIPKDIDIVPALAVLSVFCGVYYFGMIGVV